MKKDNIFKQKVETVKDFQFDKKVAAVFEDMAQRSIPFYNSLTKEIAKLVCLFHQPNTLIYDLGTSIATVSIQTAKYLNKKYKNNQDYKIVAVDSSEEMLNKASTKMQKKFKKIPSLCENIKLVHQNVREISIDSPTSVILLNFTMQFVQKQEREILIKKLYDSLNKNGVLILSEKITPSNPDDANFYQLIYENFKALNGYSETEIKQKRQSLENIMLTETMEIHQERLENAGFNARLWFAGYNFCSWIAVKS